MGWTTGWLESRRRIWRRHEPKTRRFWKQSRVPRKSKLGRLPLSFFCVFWYLFPLILYYKTILLHTCTYNLITHFLQVFFEIEIQNAMLKIKLNNNKQSSLVYIVFFSCPSNWRLYFILSGIM